MSTRSPARARGRAHTKSARSDTPGAPARTALSATCSGASAASSVAIRGAARVGAKA
jgi:hypothetical protein